jgi:hypothetical protein
MHENITYANLGIDEKIYSKFKEICDRKGLKYGKQVEIMMADFIKAATK